MVDELVEPAHSAAGGGKLGGVGEQLGGCAYGLGLGHAVNGLRERGPLRVAGLEQSGQHRIRWSVHRGEDGARWCIGWHRAGGHVGSVGLPAASHADIERLGCSGLGDDGVAGVDGEALSGMNGGGVTKRQMLGNIAGRQNDPIPLLVVGGGRARLRAVAAPPGGDGRPGLARRHPLKVGLHRGPVEKAAADVGHRDGVLVVVGFAALVLGAVVPGLTAFAGVADQGLGVQVGEGLTGHAVLLQVGGRLVRWAGATG